MEVNIDNGKPFLLFKSKERRRFRPYAIMYYKGHIVDLPRDRETLEKIKADIIDHTGYCYKRINDRGFVEDEMVEEFINIKVILRAYCEINDGEFWKEFNTFNIRFFEYLLREGLKYEKNLVIELLYKSGISASLSIYIIQYKTHIFDTNLVLNYFDISVKAKNINMLMFMTHQLCSRVKELKKIRLEDLSVEELECGIRSGYFIDRKEELGRFIRELLISRRETDSKAYMDLKVRVLKLHALGDLDISAFLDLVRDHTIYRLLYTPWTVDYKTIDINIFIGLVNVRILKGVIKYGWYDFYSRVRAAKKKNRKIGDTYILGNVLKDENFKRILYETELAPKEKTGPIRYN